jgi:hypothetical protein
MPKKGYKLGTLVNNDVSVSIGALMVTSGRLQ